jgi:molecular chaperone DnaK
VTLASPQADASWRLAIDFGTVFTVAAMARGSSSQLIDVEGDGTSRLHSGVLLETTGSLVVGNAARHQADFEPDRYEATPKRSIGDGSILLGDRTVRMVDVVAALLAKVNLEARRAAGGLPPGEVVVTHPADWAATRIGVLVEAIRKAGLPEAMLLPEPVAAAIHIGAATTAVGRHVAVYDFGGGTFDAAVLRRTEEGYAVAGPPGGRDPLGGEDLDHRIIDHLGKGPLGEHPDWQRLLVPPDLQWRRASTSLHDAVREAKEGLSTTTAWQIWVPGIEREVQLTRAELEGLIRADIELTVDVLVQTISAAGRTPADLDGIYLVGGSSRIPLIAQTIWQRLEVEPHTYDDPKAVVALGAAERAPRRPALVSPIPASPTEAPPAPSPISLAGQPPLNAGTPLPASPPRAAPATMSRRGLMAVGGVVAAVVVIAIIAVVFIVRQRSDSGPSGPTAPAAVSLTSSQLAQVVPTVDGIGTGYTKSQSTETVSDLRLCNTPPQLAGLLGEASILASNNTVTVLVDALQFSSGRAAVYLQNESSALAGCSGTWTITDSSGQQAQVNGQQVSGSQIGDQTLRVTVTLTDASGTNTVQNIVAARVNDSVALIVVEGASDNQAQADSLASAAVDRVRHVAAASPGS